MPIVDQPPDMTASSSGDISATIRALAQVLESYDPALAHRAALRCEVGHRLLKALDRSEVAPGTPLHLHIVAILALADIDLVISGSPHLELARTTARSLRSANALAPLPGMERVARELHDLQERWDGAGEPSQASGSEIAFSARVFSVCDVLVGNPAVGFLPSWEITRRQLSHRDGRFDPELIRATASIDLASIGLPHDRVDVIAGYIADDVSSAAVLPVSTPPTRPPEVGMEPDQPAVLTTVLHASEPDRLLGLMASSIMAELKASAVSFLALAPNGIDLTSVAQRGDRLANERYASELRHYSAVTELSAGVVHCSSRRIAVPIRRRGKPWGVLLAVRLPDQPEFDANHKGRLKHHADAAANTISVSEEWARLEYMATRDQLTGLYNRHELNQAIDAIFQRPATDRLDSAVIMCDVDGLKIINDTDGHDAGDQLLIDAATALRSATRNPDTTTICRIGGDEFCVVIDGGALLTAHEMSNAIERLFERSAGSGPARSISCGVAFADHSVSDRSALLKAADENQYRVKRERRRARGEAIEDHRQGDRRARR